MWGILSKIFLVVIIVLAFPTTLILASQNANPGDTAYPVKRGMEGVLQSILSFNPITAAYFKTDLSNRRFKEAITVLERNNTDQTQANASLVEMLSATANASADINSVSDPALKKKLANDLSKQITTYRQNLQQVSKTSKTKQSVSTTTTVSVTPIPSISQAPTISPTPIPTSTPAQCTVTSRDYSQCGGTTGFTNYQNTHLLLITEYTNSCDGIEKVVVSADWNLNLQCDPNLIGQCSASNLSACDTVLAELQRRLANLAAQNNGAGNFSVNSNPPASPTNPVQSGQTTSASVPTQTLTPSPTSSHKVKSQSAFEILVEREATSSSGTPSATSIP
ncbi:MAG: DUF5667 domain-containing protein [Candidatus Daviesbacteria bacterium]|nr:DUF5667 domain-containing protein [Candidatus Daviesbacteria bacterium]